MKIVLFDFKIYLKFTIKKVFELIFKSISSSKLKQNKWKTII